MNVAMQGKLKRHAGITCAFRPNRLLTGCPLGRARHAHFDRAATVRERSRSFETFDQPIFARRLSGSLPGNISATSQDDEKRHDYLNDLHGSALMGRGMLLIEARQRMPS